VSKKIGAAATDSLIFKSGARVILPMGFWFGHYFPNAKVFRELLDNAIESKCQRKFLGMRIYKKPGKWFSLLSVELLEPEIDEKTGGHGPGD
jgi:hypothetical protein